MVKRQPRKFTSETSQELKTGWRKELARARSLTGLRCPLVPFRSRARDWGSTCGEDRCQEELLNARWLSKTDPAG